MLKIRRVRRGDAAQVQALLSQLGYSTDIEFVLQRLLQMSHRRWDAVFVADLDHKVVGVMSLHALDLFHQPGRLGRITSLVVSEAVRGQGMGEMLVKAADRWFIKKDCLRAEVTSGLHRHGAHAFYIDQGYVSDERRFVKRYDE